MRIVKSKTLLGVPELEPTVHRDSRVASPWRTYQNEVRYHEEGIDAVFRAEQQPLAAPGTPSCADFTIS